jgi:ABC-type cobalamin/Fe3+-siderophores transport system ATPase subunit
LQLVVARTRAQSGTVMFGDVPYDDMSARERAGILTLMPQTLAILDATIADNLAFGRGTPATELSEWDLEIVEKTGLGAICQMKALAMMPGDASGGAIVERIAGIREKVRKRLADEGFKVMPFEAGGRDPDDTVIERLANARADRSKVLERLFDPKARRALDKLGATPLGHALTARVAPMLEETRALLSLPSFAEYSKLAAVPIDERVWQKRVAVFGLKEDAGKRADQRDLVLVALTAKVREYGDPPDGDRSPTDALESVLADVSVSLDAESIHPYLTWRDNVVFGRVEAPNSRAEGRVDQLVLETLANEGHERDLIRIGLAFSVGRGGARLSGGQRQIIALTRALLRRTPVLVLDEPTSALDPNSRSRVATLLKEWAKGRVVITVSHDPEFVKEADQIRMFEAGRLVAAGRFEDLHRENAAFRNVLKL